MQYDKNLQEVHVLVGKVVFLSLTISQFSPADLFWSGGLSVSFISSISLSRDQVLEAMGHSLLWAPQLLMGIFLRS